MHCLAKQIVECTSRQCIFWLCSTLCFESKLGSKISDSLESGPSGSPDRPKYLPMILPIEYSRQVPKLTDDTELGESWYANVAVGVDSGGGIWNDTYTDEAQTTHSVRRVTSGKLRHIRLMPTNNHCG